MNELIKQIVDFLNENEITIRTTADENLIITNQKTGEEYIMKDLGYPF